MLHFVFQYCFSNNAVLPPFFFSSTGRTVCIFAMGILMGKLFKNGMIDFLKDLVNKFYSVCS